MFSEIHFSCQKKKIAQVLSFHKVLTRTPPLASSSRLSPRDTWRMQRRSRNVHARPPRAPAQKNLLPYPLKGWWTEQGDRSSPLIPFYPSGFSNKCAPQAFNLWPLHLPHHRRVKKKKKKKKAPKNSEQSWHMLSSHVFFSLLPPSLSLSLGVDPWASALVSHRALWLWDG